MTFTTLIHRVRVQGIIETIPQRTRALLIIWLPKNIYLMCCGPSQMNQHHSVVHTVQDAACLFVGLS